MKQYPCRICGAPGRLYVSGRWCSVHYPGNTSRRAA